MDVGVMVGIVLAVGLPLAGAALVAWRVLAVTRQRVTDWTTQAKDSDAAQWRSIEQTRQTGEQTLQMVGRIDERLRGHLDAHKERHNEIDRRLDDHNSRLKEQARACEARRHNATTGEGP